jgi:UDP-2-acetamido-2-deoxy-ribo-hexuluronate aminotransferase
VEFRDLKKQYYTHKRDIDQAIESVLLNTDFIMGDAVKKLETRRSYKSWNGSFCQYRKFKKYCITCGNGTDALQLALMTWEIGKGDAVFVPDFTFFSSGEVVSLCGATPVFVDISKNTFNIDPDDLESAIEKCISEGELKPRVIVAVDLFGQPADYDRIRRIADKYNLYVLEDGAQGFGGRIGDKAACSFGDIATTSFFPAKPLGCYGDGGAVFTDNDAWAELLRSLRVHGKGTDKYDNIRIGMNSRLDTIQAAVLNVKLKFLEEEIEACNRVAAQYTAGLKNIVETPVITEGMRSSWAQYTILLKSSEERELVMGKLKEAGIPSAVYYKKPMHKQVAFNNKCQGKNCLKTEEISQTCLSLPMHAYLEPEEIKTICNVICETLKEVER